MGWSDTLWVYFRNPFSSIFFIVIFFMDVRVLMEWEVQTMEVHRNWLFPLTFLNKIHQIGHLVKILRQNCHFTAVLDVAALHQINYLWTKKTWGIQPWGRNKPFYTPKTEEIDFLEKNTVENLLLRYKNRFQSREPEFNIKRRNCRYFCNPYHDFWHWLQLTKRKRELKKKRG